MSDCILVLGQAGVLPETDCDLVGADRGALTAVKQGKRLRLAIGDFDSVSEEERKLIEEMSDEVIRLNPVKDESDSQAALEEIMKRGYERVLVIGAFGGRLDHEAVNLRLARRYPGRVVLQNENNRITVLGAGQHKIVKNGYRYLSVLPLTDCRITLSGMKYPLEGREMTPDDLYGLSNEITDETGLITIGCGLVMVIQSDDSH